MIDADPETGSPGAPPPPRGVRRAVPTAIVLGVLAALGVAAGCWWARSFPYLAGLVLAAIVPAVLVHRRAYFHRLRGRYLISLGLGGLILATGVVVPAAVARPRANIRWTVPNATEMGSCLRSNADLVYVCRGDTLTAYRVQTGAAAWHVRTGEQPHLRFTDDGHLLIRSFTGEDSSTTWTLLDTDGTRLWRLPHEHGSVARVLAYDQGVTVTVNGCDPTCLLTGIGLDGRVVWRRNVTHAYEGLDERPLWLSHSAQTPVPGVVAFSTSPREGHHHVVIMDPTDGTTEVDDPEPDLSEREPVVSGDRVLVSMDGVDGSDCAWRLYRSGRRVWQRSGLCGDAHHAVPYLVDRVVGETVYVWDEDDNNVESYGVIDLRSGAMRRLRASEWTSADVRVQGSLLGFGTVLAVHGSQLVATDPRTGTRLWARHLVNVDVMTARWPSRTVLVLSANGSGHNPTISRHCRMLPFTTCRAPDRGHSVVWPTRIRTIDQHTGRIIADVYEPHGASAVAVGAGALFVVPDDRDRPAYLTGTTG